MPRHSTVMHRIWDMNFCARQLQRTIMQQEAARLLQMKSLYLTGQRVTPEIFRRFSVRITRSRSVIRYTRFMWIPTLWLEEPVLTTRRPEFPKKTPVIIYLCLPNNPTGTTLTKDQLQEWVDYANKVGAVIIYDAAYEAYISEDNVAHSIYECKGARTCAIELHSFSKNAGFTGVRLGYTVVPKDLKCGEVSLHDMWARRHGTKFNGAPYIVQRAGEAVYSEEGKAQLKEQVAYYMKNAKTIKEGLKDAGYTVFGGVNAPYIWLKTPDQMTSWEFFDYLLENANVVGTPGSGFGPSGEGYFRLTAFGNYENTVKALERIKAL